MVILDNCVLRCPNVPHPCGNLVNINNGAYEPFKLALSELARKVITLEKVSEMRLAEKLIEKAPEHSLTLFDRRFYSTGLLYQWANTGTDRYGLSH